MANDAAWNVHPFPKNDQLNEDSIADLATRHGIRNTAEEWDGCFASDLQTGILDEIYPYLWLVARKSGAHINPLHQQLVKQRNIVVTEDPKLHLVWYYGTIYLKPLPDYLFNYAIWQTHISLQPAHTRYDKYRAALGFLRSYGFLIRHESDFIIAQRANLLPQYISFQGFQKFIQSFRFVNDDDVSHRYRYGQFRLTRLNWAVRIICIIRIIYPVHPKEPLPWNYHEELWQTSQYIQHYTAPLVFIFAILTLILSSMQVALAALADNAWDTFARVSWGFSVATIIFAVVCIALTLISVFVLLTLQGQFALKMKWKETQRKNDVEYQKGPRDRIAAGS
ncbi:hypothetical protein F5Y10DRAFT_66296 [Nemania abortiva]|nr:hypothetical protein F5Y10DRAFT_66296 [Nemania abortiva]